MSTATPPAGSSRHARRQRWAHRLAAGLIRRRWWVLGGATGVLLLAGWTASTLRLETSFAKLLPDRDPAVLGLHELERRVDALSTVIAVVQGPSPAVNRRFVDALTARLRQLRSPAIQAVESGVQLPRAFFQRHRQLYASPKQLRRAERRLRMEVAKRKNPLLVEIDDEGERPEVLLRKAEQGAKSRWERFPGGYFALPDRTLFAVVVWVRTSVLRGGDGEPVARLVQRESQRLLERLRPGGVTLGFTGNVITAAEERHALINDLLLATTVSVLLVALVVWGYFRTLWSLPLTVLPALGGVICAMAFAALAFGELNLSTAFLGAIIVGNGINYAIIQCARYEEERRRGLGVVEAAGRALATTWRPTVIAALGAAIAYGSLALTSFRGFKQFGTIGGIGMCVAWLLSVLLLPPLWRLLDHRTAPRLHARHTRHRLLTPLAQLTQQHAARLIGLGLALSLLAALPLPRYLHDPFEYDFRNLRTGSDRAARAEQLSGRLDPIFGRDLAPGFILTASPAQAEQVRRVLQRRQRHSHLLGKIHTVSDLLPGTQQQQQEKIATLQRIRALIDANMPLFDPALRRRLARLRPADSLRPLRPRDLPLAARRFFTERSGEVGRVVLYTPRTDITVWDGRVQLQLAQLVQRVQLPDGQVVRSSGPAVVFAGMLRAIIHDGPLVTAAALVGVLLVVTLLTRSVRGAWQVVGVLIFGVLWTVGAAAAAGVRVNFLNFVALPITFGIGVDYGVNLYLRYRQEGPGGVGTTISSTGGAVTLCSLTTIIGYGALLVADSHALRSFGALAMLGELACLVAAMVLLPAVAHTLEQLHPRRGARGNLHR